MSLQPLASMNVDDQPLHEALRYNPTKLESSNRTKWYQSDSELGAKEIADGLGILRHLTFQDFFTRTHRMYATVHTELSRPATIHLDPVVLHFAQHLGCQTEMVIPLQGEVGEVENPEAWTTNAPASADLVRLALLRSKPHTENLDAKNLQIAGPTRFLQRVWRLCRTATQDIPRIRFGPALQIDEEITQQMTSFTNDCFDAFQRRSPGQYIAAVSTAQNDLHRYVFSEIGPNAETIEQAVDSLILHLATVCPFMGAELWTSKHR